MQIRDARCRRGERAPVLFPDPAVPVVAYSRQVGPPGRYHVHAGDDWELCYVATGSAEYRLVSGSMRLEAGDMLVVGPDDPHACLSWRGERVVTIFRRAILRGSGLPARCGRALGLEVAGVRIPSPTRVVPWRRTTVEYLLDRLQRETFGGQRAKRSMCVALLAQLLLELARSEGERRRGTRGTPAGAAGEVVERVAAMVRGDLARGWTLAELVKRSGYGSTQIGVLFRRATGLSPCQWISQERIHRACQLLAHSDRTVLDVGIEVGFNTRSQFHRVFRKTTGTTPERYRSAVLHEAHP